MTTAITVDLKLTPVALRLLNPAKGKSRLARELHRASFTVGSKIASRMRGVISGGVPPPQAEFTKMIKGSTKTLFDEARMYKAITWKVSKTGGLPSAIHVGILRSSREANVAVVVHRGAKIRVTKRMAILFGVLSAISQGKSRRLTSRRAEELASRKSATFLPLREGTEIVIPSRPFAAITFADPAIRSMVNKEFSKAMWRALFKK